MGYPGSKRDRVVLDPARQFGSPILEDSGTPTDILYASYPAEGENEDAVDQTAAIYGIAARYVRSAIRFEERLRQRLH